MRLYVLAAALPLWLAGCSTPNPVVAPPPAQSGKPSKVLEPAPAAETYDYSESYGSYPDNYQALIRTYFGSTLYDAASAKFAQFSKPRQEHMMHNQKMIFGYSSCVLIDAKNQFGQYTGFQLHWVFYKNGKIIRTQNISTGLRNIYIGRMVNCQDG